MSRRYRHDADLGGIRRLLDGRLPADMPTGQAAPGPSRRGVWRVWVVVLLALVLTAAAIWAGAR